MSVTVFSGPDVLGAVSPGAAVETVRRAFVDYARGEWRMPPKVYVEAAPYGDFRAMPAAGAGHAALKWVTSFPGNPTRGLPTVTGALLLSDGTTGELRALLDAAAVTALRTGAAAALAAETLARPGAGRAAVVGCGTNGRAAAQSFADRGRDVLLFDVRPEQAAAAARTVGPQAVATTRLEEALACDIVVTVTPGREPVVTWLSLRPGQHVCLMGADGPGKAEIEVDELARARVVCDEWEQASHNGDIAPAVASGRLTRADVAELGRVLLGEEEGRRSEDEITVFDSTGLAVQDLAIALAVLDRFEANPDADAFASVVEIDL